MSGYEQALQNLSAAREALPDSLIDHVLHAVESVAGHLGQAGTGGYDGLLSQVGEHADAARAACTEIRQGLDEDIARTQQLMGGT